MSNRVVNLTFHGVGAAPPHVDEGEKEVWVTLDFFRGVLDLVKDHAHVRITFDDGNASDYEVGLPELVERGLSADFFVCAGRIDQPGYLSARQIGEMREAGMRIGSHGFRHRAWRRLDAESLIEEIDTAKRRIEEAAEAPVQTAACPFGEYDTRSLGRLKELGFQTVFTSDRGSARPGEWLQCRNTLRKWTTVEQVDHLLTDRGFSLADLTRRTKTLLKRWR